MAAAYGYGNLLSPQARRGYEVQRHKVTSGDLGTADWQGAVAASAHARGTVQAAEARAAADMAQAGVSAYGQVASSNVNALAQVGSTAIGAYGRKREAEIAADVAIKQAASKRFAGGVAAVGMGIAPIISGFGFGGEKRERIPTVPVPDGKTPPKA